MPGISGGTHTLWGTRAASEHSPQLWDPLSQSLLFPAVSQPSHEAQHA